SPRTPRRFELRWTDRNQVTENRALVEHEEAFIRAFVRADRRSRFLEILRSSKGRAKFRASLAHFRHLDARFAQLIPASKHNARDIEAILHARSAPDTCHVLSESAALDGRDMLLGSALADI